MYRMEPMPSRPANGTPHAAVHEPGLDDLFGDEGVAAVEDMAAAHAAPEPLGIGRTELAPLRRDHQGIGALTGLVRIGEEVDLVGDLRAHELRVRRVERLRIHRAEARALRHALLDELQRGRLTHVVRPRLERESPERDDFPGEAAERTLQVAYEIRHRHLVGDGRRARQLQPYPE